jgi:hypothetical protein
LVQAGDRQVEKLLPRDVVKAAGNLEQFALALGLTAAKGASPSRNHGVLYTRPVSAQPVA